MNRETAICVTLLGFFATVFGLAWKAMDENGKM